MGKKLVLKKSFSATNSIASAPQKGIMFTTLTQDELRAAQKNGRLPNKEHYFSPYPRMSADDAKMGLFGQREIPRANKPVFVVGVKLPNTSGLRPVPHGVPMYTKSGIIPFSDVKEIHEIRVNTASGFHQFRRMGGINKSWGFQLPVESPSKKLGPAPPKTQYSATPPEHMSSNDFRNSQRMGYHSGVSGPHDTERVMPLIAPSKKDAILHQQNASWSQRFSSPQSLDYNKGTIEKFLDNGTHQVYKTNGLNAYPQPDSPPITNSADFKAEYPNIKEDLKWTEKQQPLIKDRNDYGEKDKSDELEKETDYWHLGDKNYHEPQTHFIHGNIANLKDPNIWKDDILPYLKKNGDNEFDKALLEHAQNNIAHQETYGQNYPTTAGNVKITEKGRELDPNNHDLRPDHSMWHFIDRSPAMKKYLLERGYTGGDIPNFLSGEHPYYGQNNLTVMANQDAISKERNSDNVHQSVKEAANPWDGQVPPANHPWENPYDKPVEPIEHLLQSPEKVQETVKNRLSEHGLSSQISPTGFLSLPEDSPKLAEPHVMFDVSKGAISSAFGVDPRIFNRVALKMPNFQPRSDKDNALGWQLTEGASMRGNLVQNARDPNRKEFSYHIMMHEMVHALQQEASGSTSNENNKRYRSFKFGQRAPDEEMKGKVEGHTELMSTILTGALFGNQKDALEDTPYQRYVYGLANHLRSSTKGNAAQALDMLKKQTMKPMEQQNFSPHNDDDSVDSRVQKAGAESFIEKMISVARGETPKSSSPVAEAAKRKDNLWMQRPINQQEKKKR